MHLFHRLDPLDQETLCLVSLIGSLQGVGVCVPDASNLVSLDDHELALPVQQTRQLPLVRRQFSFKSHDVSSISAYTFSTVRFLGLPLPALALPTAEDPLERLDSTPLLRLVQNRVALLNLLRAAVGASIEGDAEQGNHGITG